MTSWRSLYRDTLPAGARRRVRQLYGTTRQLYDATRTSVHTSSLAVRNRLVRSALADDGSGVIVSLTTFPARLPTVFLAIESIFRQTLPPSAVYLWLFEGEIKERDLPTELRRLRERGLRIELVPENLKGAKKLVYAAERFSGRPIVTADDDLIYPPLWLESLVGAAAETPGTVVCHRGHFLTLRGPRSLSRYRDCMANGLGGARPSFNLLPTAGAGALYPPGVLDPRIGDKELMMRLCPTADDIWFKAMTLLQGVRSRRVAERNLMPATLPETQHRALYDINQHTNDRQLAATFAYFDLYALLHKVNDRSTRAAHALLAPK